MKNRKVYVVGRENGYASWLRPIGFELTKNMESADLVMGTGGADWSAYYYNEVENPTTSSYPERDEYELEEFKKVIELNKPFVGICRSAQGSSVMAGGKLIQNMRHPSWHNMKTIDGKEFEISSSHHQMMFPFNLPDDHYTIIGWTNNLSPYHEGGKQEEMNPPVEPEIVYFHKINFLGVQNHPEYCALESENVKYCQNLVNLLVDNKLESFLEDHKALTV